MNFKRVFKDNNKVTGTWVIRTMSQCSETHLLTPSGEHAILSESGPMLKTPGHL